MCTEPQKGARAIVSSSLDLPTFRKYRPCRSIASIGMIQPFSLLQTTKRNLFYGSHVPYFQVPATFHIKFLGAQILNFDFKLAPSNFRCTPTSMLRASSCFMNKCTFGCCCLAITMWLERRGFTIVTVLGFILPFGISRCRFFWFSARI